MAEPALQLSSDPVEATLQVLEAVDVDIKISALQLALVVYSSQVGLSTDLFDGGGANVVLLEKTLHTWAEQLVTKVPHMVPLIDRNWAFIKAVRAERALGGAETGSAPLKEIIQLPQDYAELKKVGDALGLPVCSDALAYTDAIAVMDPSLVVNVLRELKG